jgi:hypothetical protein
MGLRKKCFLGPFKKSLFPNTNITYEKPKSYAISKKAALRYAENAISTKILCPLGSKTPASLI